MKIIVILILILLTSCDSSYNQTWVDFNSNYIMDVYENTDMSIDIRVDDLVSRLTLEEKISQMESGSPSIDRLGIPAYNWMNEALHGVRASGNSFFEGESGNDNTTVFPISIALAATWNKQLAYDQGNAISDEARALANKYDNALFLDFWTPVINIARDPRWGRTQEGYGEDPHLVSTISTKLIKGLQGKNKQYFKVIASPKHFVANNSEFNRHWGTSNISEKVLRDYYLPAFKSSIIDGGAYSIMSAYNALNGIPCTANENLLETILREEWGFEGYVVSDCNAIADVHINHKYSETGEEAVALALKAGTDLNCGSYYRKYLFKAVKAGLVSEKIVDKSIKRLFKARMLLGLFDPKNKVPYSKIDVDVIESEKHQALAKKISSESIVLLKNENNFLPLDKDINSIAVIGPNANSLRFGNYSGTTSYSSTPLEGIQNIVSKLTKVYFSQGSQVLEDNLPVISSKYFRPKSGDTRRGVLAEYYDNPNLKGKPIATKLETNIDFNLGFENVPHSILSKNDWSARWSGVFIPKETGQKMLNVSGVDGLKFYFENELIFDKWNENYSHNSFITKSLKAGEEYSFVFEYGEDEGWQSAKLGMKQLKNNLLSDAVNLASNSDVAIVFAGTYEMIEAVGRDRESIDLPKEQIELIKKVYEVNPNMCLVLINGSSLSVNWENENIPSILEAWFPGEAGGEAIAEVLFGDYNPSGKLPITFYKNLNQLPPIDDYDVTKGRTYMYMKEKPLYPFGFGLSYTNFEPSNFSIENTSISVDDTLFVSFELENIGDFDGSEVVQLYIHEHKNSIYNPSKILKAYKKVFLKVDEKKTISLKVPVRDFATYDVTASAYVVSPGNYDVLVGNSSENIYYKTEVKID